MYTQPNFYTCLIYIYETHNIQAQFPNNKYFIIIKITTTKVTTNPWD